MADVGTDYKALRSMWFKTALAGAGICSDAYNLFAINLVKNVLNSVYTLSDGEQSAISTAALIGAVLGQLIFGPLADRLGRRLIFVVSICLVIVGALGSATSTQLPGFSLAAQLSLWHILLGLGVGAEYPLSATVSSEAATQENRGRAVSSVFAMQGVGNILSSLCMYALLQLPLELDVVWRIALALGAVPGLATVYWRYKMEESHQFTQLQHQHPHGHDQDTDAGEDRDTATLVARGPSGEGAALREPAEGGHLPSLRHTLAAVYRHRWTLLGTAGSWCIFDIVFYANGLFSGTVLSYIGFGTGGAKILGQKELSSLAVGNLIIASIGLPGYVIAVLTVDYLGRRNMQLMGFVMITLLFAILGAALQPLEASAQWLLILLYGGTFLFSNWGPNSSTYLIPAEAFPTSIKATCHGISAASGKIGAAVGAAAMAPLLDYFGTSSTQKQQGLALVLYICAAIGLVGSVWTFFLTRESRDLTIEGLDAEDAAAAEQEELGNWDGPQQKSADEGLWTGSDYTASKSNSGTGAANTKAVSLLRGAQ